jgi:catechol 2,3-dioxygenase
VERLPADTRMGPVHLTVSDLDRSLGYWGDTIGLRVRGREDGRASLGDGDELLVLVEEPGVRPSHGHTGLFHVALLVPERRDLARFLAHAARDGVTLTGLSDHDVSEAIYLRDPDYHGIEVYADRPRELWDGQVRERMTTRPLDVEGLLGELEDPESEPFDGLPGGTVVGHVHFKASSIPETVGFYRDLLGFDVTASLGDQAAFLSAGGYHHHVGANVWESAGAPPPPPGHAALRHATIVLPTEDTRDEVVARVGAEDSPHGPLVRDPSGNALVLAAAE